MKELLKALTQSGENEEYKRRIVELFKYDTLDEADPKKERIRSDVTVELGGPCGSVRFTILTREEHTILKTALLEIINNRITTSESIIDNLCKKRINEQKRNL